MFFDNSCYESISQEFMEVRGDDTNAITLAGGLGYAMQQDQYLVKENVEAEINRNFIIGFWLYPVNPGMTFNIDTRENVSIEMPLLNFIYSGFLANRAINITEHTTDTDANYMKISLDNDTYIASTPEYTVGLWHYFWIAYNGFSNSFSVYIDGKEVALENIQGNVPDNLNADLVDIYVNHDVLGYDFNRAKNYGFIDNIVVFNHNFHSDVPLQTIINKGIYYAIDTDYMNVEEKNQPIVFEDPYRITINSMIDDMSYVYLARSDGKILQGSPLFWEVRKNLSSKDELEIAQLENKISGDDYEITPDGFLSINDSIIEI